MRLRRVTGFLLLLACAPLWAAAHDPGLGTAQAAVGRAEITLDLGYSPADLARLPAGAPVWTVLADGAAIAPQRAVRTVESASTIRWKLTFPRPGAAHLRFVDAAIDRLPPG